MKIAFYMNCVSMHQLPLAREVAKLVDSGKWVVDSGKREVGSNFVYIDAGLGGQAYQSASGEGLPFEVIDLTQRRRDAEVWLEKADLVLTGLRDLELIERRAAKGLKTCYYSERWFKPILVGSGKWVVCSLPGWLRMLVPSYRKMAKRFVKWANEDKGAKVLAVGPWAKKDFLKMGVKEEKIVDWGYFVEPSRFGTQVADATRKIGQDLNAKPGDISPERSESRSDALAGVQSTSCPVESPKQLKVLWVGRDLAWKRVIDIERAVTLANKKLISALQLQLDTTTKPITFTKLTGVTPAEVRAAMRSHDVYVLASNAEEGWGAALNEAFEEGMSSIGTFEAGASAAMLPKERLYHAGDVKELARLLTLEVKVKDQGEQRNLLPPCGIGEWTAKKAAQRLVELGGREVGFTAD